MELVKVGQFRTWKSDTNNEHFKIIKYKSFFCNEHYYIIEYTTDGRQQTVSQEDLLKNTVISHMYDGKEKNAFE